MGFIVDKNLFKLGKLLNERKIDCMIPDQQQSKDSELICAKAIEMDRIFITSNLKLFNKKNVLKRCCVHYKDNPFRQLDALSGYFGFE